MTVADNLFRDSGVIAFHPKWGYIVAWTDTPQAGSSHSDDQSIVHGYRGGGLYVVRGPGFVQPPASQTKR